MKAEILTHETFLNAAQVSDRYGINRATTWRWINAGIAFPRPVTLSPGTVRWRLSELEAWEASRQNTVAA